MAPSSNWTLAVTWVDKGAEKTYVVSTRADPGTTPAAQDQAAQDAASAASAASTATGTGTGTSTGKMGGGQ